MQVLDVEGSHKAFEVLERAKTSMSRVDEKETDLYCLTCAKYLFTIGKAHQEAHPETALDNFLESLRIMELLLGDHTDEARCLNAIGNCYQCLEEPDSAIEYFIHAHDMRERLSGEEHYDMPVYKSQIGAVFDRKGDYDEAIEWYQSAIDLEEKLKISGYKSTATYYLNIANAYLFKEQFADAVEPAQKAYDIWKEVLGDHPDTTRSIFQLGLILNLQEEREKAVEFYKEAWEMEKSLEKGHHSAVRDRIVEDLRELYDDFHRKEEKRLFEEDALNFYCRIWDEEKSCNLECQFSASTAKIINMIIDLCKALGSKEAEMKMYQREVLKLYKDAWEQIRDTLAELKGDKTREIEETVIKARCAEILWGIIEFVQALDDEELVKELVKELVINKAEMKKYQEEALHWYEKIWEQRDTLAELKWDKTRPIEEDMIKARVEVLEGIIKLAKALCDKDKFKLFEREKLNFYKEVYFAEGIGDIIKEHTRPLSVQDLEREEQCTRKDEFPVEPEGSKLIIN